jgi:hypothetical protein
MKTARSIVQELIRYVDPPRGIAIVVNEAPSTRPDDPNCVAYPAVDGPDAKPTPLSESGRTTQVAPLY